MHEEVLIINNPKLNKTVTIDTGKLTALNNKINKEIKNHFPNENLDQTVSDIANGRLPLFNKSINKLITWHTWEGYTINLPDQIRELINMDNKLQTKLNSINYYSNTSDQFFSPLIRNTYELAKEQFDKAVETKKNMDILEENLEEQMSDIDELLEKEWLTKPEDKKWEEFVTEQSPNSRKLNKKLEKYNETKESHKEMGIRYFGEEEFNRRYWVQNEQITSNE